MKKIILVVENDYLIRFFIGILLELEEYEVHLCGTTKCFREKIFQLKPDLVIIDVRLPDGNGIDLCCEMKKNYNSSDIPVIMTYVHSNPEEIQSKCDPDDFIQKPFDLDDFIERVSRLIRKVG